MNIVSPRRFRRSLLQFSLWTGILSSSIVSAATGLPPGLSAALSRVADAQLADQQAKLTAPIPVYNGEFGYAVAVDGDTAVVGMHNSDNGAAYVFVRDGAAWNLQATLAASDGQFGDGLGYSVAIYGDTAVVGAPSAATRTGAAYVFVRSGTVWSQQAKLVSPDGESAQFFGRSVAVAGDTAVVGSPMASSAGAAETGVAYVFVRNGSNWSEQSKLLASDPEAFSNFGNSLAITGNTLIAGATHADVGGVRDAGAAYVFVRSGTAWIEQAKLTAADKAAEDNFGYSVAISGNTAVAGVPGADGAGDENPGMGAAYVFERVGTAWSQRAKLTGTPEEPDALLGHSVGIAGDLLVAGSPYANASGKLAGGATYVFTRDGAAWSQRDRLTVDLTDGNDELFGWSVAVSGGAALAGAYGADIGSTAMAGAAYAYALPNTQSLLNVVPQVGGTIVSDPAGIDCGGACRAGFVTGTNVILKADPAPGYSVTGWTGCDNADGNACTVNANTDKTVSATFEGGPGPTPVPTIRPTPAPTVRPTPTPGPTPPPVPQAGLSVVKVGEGTVNSSPAGIACGEACTASFDAGSVVTLTAVSAEGYKFKRWSGAGCENQGKKPCKLKLRKARTVTAKFVRKSK